MKADELEAILGVCLQAAREAGELVQDGFRNKKKLAVEHKGPVDLVTQYDRDSEAMIRARLQASFPHPVIGEEAGGHEGDAVFYVDPIDGTTNFVHGHPFWCVSIGLVTHGRPILGVVHAPMLGLEWFGWTADDGTARAVRRSCGTRGAGGAEEELCAVSANESFQDALLATGFPYDRRTSTDNNFDAFVTIKRRVQAVRRCGSAALELCFVADGTYEGFWERKLGPWDIAAGIAIVRAAGGTVTDFEGGETFIGTGHVIATNGAIHRELLEELARVHARTTPAT